MKNWKTTLLGILTAIAMVFGSAGQSRLNGGSPITAGSILPAIGVAVLGVVAKDAESSPVEPTSGGSK